MLRPTLRWTLVLITALTASCASTGGSGGGELPATDLGPIPTGEVLTWREMAMGEYLTELDGRMGRWFALKARTDPDSVRLRDVLETEIRRFVSVRPGDLVHELTAGPPRNRMIAAAGLGFSDDEAALGALIAALDDPDQDVEHQALLGLGLLADPDTPVDPLLERLRGSTEGLARNNAAYAVFRLVRADVRDEELATALRLALLDDEPSVRAQAAAALGVMADPDSIDALSGLLDDELDFVYVAAVRSLIEIAREDLTKRGAVARALVGAWESADGGRRTRLRRDLTSMAGVDYGERAEDWQRWSLGLP